MRLLYISCFAALAATPLAAQDICGGRSAGGTWIGGSEAISDIATAPSAQEQMALVLGGNEYIALFNLSAAADVRLEAQGRGAGDPQIDVFDSAGNIIISDDDSGGNGAARAETALDAGSYCLAVRSYDGSPLTAFVRIGLTSQEALTDGLSPQMPDTPTTAAPTGSCMNANPLDGALNDGGLTGIGSANQGGYWRFLLEEDAAITITATNEAADPVLKIFDADQTLLRENDDFDGLNSQIEFADGLTAGEYCLEVTAIDDADAPISVSVRPFDPDAAAAQAAASGDTAPPLDGSVEIVDLGVLDGRLRRDLTTRPSVSWFSITLAQPGLLLAEVAATDGQADTWIVVFDDLGRKVAQNDDYGEGYDSLIAAKLPTGDYYIGVKQLAEDGTGRARMLMERYVPAP